MPSSLAVRRALPWLGLAFGAVTALAIVAIDRPLARFYDDHGVSARATWTAIRQWLDDHHGFDVHKWFAAYVFAGIGVALLAIPRLRGAARVWWYAALVHVAARMITTELKPALGRLRPSQWIERGADGPTFLEGGISFPSGHASYYLGLVVPLAVAWPRIGLPLLIVPCFVAWSRVAVNAHFVADITGSAALVLVLAWALAYPFRIGRPWRR